MKDLVGILIMMMFAFSAIAQSQEIADESLEINLKQALFQDTISLPNEQGFSEQWIVLSRVDDYFSENGKLELITYVFLRSLDYKHVNVLFVPREDKFRYNVAKT